MDVCIYVYISIYLIYTFWLEKEPVLIPVMT